MRASWLIPVRDAAGTVGEAVASALADSGADDEVIVVDDGSADALAEEPPGGGGILPADRRLRVLHAPPGGIVAALERGRRLARGAILARLDADDRALPGRLEAQRAALAADPRLAAVGGRARIRRDDGPVPEGMRRYVAELNGIRDPHPVLLAACPLFHPAVALRAAAVAAIGGYRDGDFPEDYDLWLRLAGAGWRLANLDREVVLLRDRDDRLTRRDPRYRRAAFRALKMAWVDRHLLPEPRRVVVWGAGRNGRPWIRHLLERGHAVPAALDLAPGGTRRGVPVLPPEALRDLDFDLLLVAVGARGARAIIRERIAALRPDLVEGRDWWAVA